MAQDNIIVNLPGCGGTATIRAFVKNKDRRAMRRAMLAAKEFDQKELEDAAKKAKENGDEDSMTFTVKGDTLTDVMDLQVKCLLLEYDGNTEDPYGAMENSEYEEDMNAVEAAVKSVFDKGGDKETVEKKSKAGKRTTPAI